ncbi:7806_t:CDS:2, partial [Funneliformis mosseae]
YITCDSPGKPAVFLIDRKNYYHEVPSLWFPVYGDPTFSRFYEETLIDCELINDIESNGRASLRLLVFDFVVNKEMERSYGLEKVLKQIIPSLKHNLRWDNFYIINIGLFGREILKWKPPNENSIDLKLSFDFKRHNKNNKPRFCLYKWMDVHRYFDNMYVTDEEWEQFWKHDFQQFEGRIVEVVYNPSIHPPWRFKRFRDDQPRANNHTVIEKIEQSIFDGITEEQAHIFSILNYYKR